MSIQENSENLMGVQCLMSNEADQTLNLNILTKSDPGKGIARAEPESVGFTWLENLRT